MNAPKTTSDYFKYIGIPEVQGFLTDEILRQDGIYVPRAYMEFFDGDATDALLFSQIFFWHVPYAGKPKMQHWHKDHLWIVKQYGEWESETGIKERTIKRSMERIEKSGLIVVEVHYSPFHKNSSGAPARASFIRIVWNAWLGRVNAYLEKTSKISSESANMELTIGSKKAPSEDTNLALLEDADSVLSSFPDITPETTPEITPEIEKDKTSGGLTPTTNSDIPISGDKQITDQPQSPEKSISSHSQKQDFADFGSDETPTKDVDPINPEVLEDAPLEKLVQQAYPKQPTKLTDNQRMTMRKTVSCVVNGVATELPSPHDLFETTPLYQRFVSWAIGKQKEYANNTKGKAGVRASKDAIIAHLRNYDRPYDGWLIYEVRHRNDVSMFDDNGQPKSYDLPEDY